MGAKLPGKLLSLLIILKVFGSTEASCRLSGSYADCRSQGLISVPQNLPTGITNLNLQNNQITTLSQSDFSRYGSLTRLDLHINDIATINIRAFYNLPALTELYLHRNRLSNLSADMFTGLGNLQHLYLQYNEISDIQAGTFNSTPQLRTLQLHQNKLTTLRSDMFTGLGNLQELWLHNNEISDIHAGTFKSTSQLTTLYMYYNKLTALRSDMFTGLGNLQEFILHSNEISDIQAGTFNATSQLRNLYLQYNSFTVLKAEIFAKLSSIYTVNINNNPWQCDCRMVPFRQKMTGNHSFENQITCEEPSNVHGQKLKDISPEDLICEEPTIVRFESVHNYTVVEGESLYLVCEASGTPKPEITVIFPSGLTATVSSGGRMTVGLGENGAITITNVTAADAGLYVCVAASLDGSTCAILVVNVEPKATTTGPVAPVTYPLTTNSKPESSSSYHESVFVGTAASPVGSTSATLVVNLKATMTATTTGTVTVAPVTSPLTMSMNSKSESNSIYHESVPAFCISVPVFIGSVCASVVGTVLICAMVFAIWHKRKRQKPSSDQTPPVVFSNTLANVTISEHDKTEQCGVQSTSDSLKNARSSEKIPGCPDSQDIEYEDVVMPPRNVSTSPNAAGLIQQPHEYQSLVPNRNRAPGDELPPLPPPSNRNNGGPTGAHGTSHYYQSLKKKHTSNQHF